MSTDTNCKALPYTQDQKTNIEISKFIYGWEDFDLLCEEWDNSKNPKIKLHGTKPNDDIWHLVPDFANDLNAMEEAWKKLAKIEGLNGESIRTSYGENLTDIAEEDIKENGGSLFYILPNLTARQKAMALVETISNINP